MEKIRYTPFVKLKLTSSPKLTADLTHNKLIYFTLLLLSSFGSTVKIKPRTSGMFYKEIVYKTILESSHPTQQIISILWSWLILMALQPISGYFMTGGKGIMYIRQLYLHFCKVV